MVLAVVAYEARSTNFPDGRDAGCCRLFRGECRRYRYGVARLIDEPEPVSAGGGVK
jgi:hypothetical protein